MPLSPRAVGTLAAVVTVALWTGFIIVGRASAAHTLTPFDLALVRLLVNAGADAGRAEVDGQTAATLARAAGHGALADWIEQRAGQQR